MVLGAAAAGILIRGRPLRPAVRTGLAVLFVGAALWFAPRRVSAADQPDWKPYASEAVARAGRPAVLDFSADWCIPCRELDEKTFSDPRVRERLERRSLFKADMTKATEPQVLRLAEQYAILGVPTIVFLDASGRERTDLRLVGFENAERFLERLAKAP